MRPRLARAPGHDVLDLSARDLLGQVLPRLAHGLVTQEAEWKAPAAGVAVRGSHVCGFSERGRRADLLELRSQAQGKPTGEQSVPCGPA